MTTTAATAATAAAVPVPVCSYCREFLGTLARRHPIEVCPLKRGSYCGNCACYGHSPAECPDIRAVEHQEPRYVEQLIPSALLAQYNIQSLTPLTTERQIPETWKDYYWEVPETGEALRAALTAAGVKPMICQEKGKKEKTELKENKRRLQKVADLQGRKLLFLAVPEEEEMAVAGAAVGVPVIAPSSSQEGEGKKTPKKAAIIKKRAAPSKENGEAQKSPPQSQAAA